MMINYGVLFVDDRRDLAFVREDFVRVAGDKTLKLKELEVRVHGCNGNMVK